MINNFYIPYYDDAYHYSPSYYPGYSANMTQNNKKKYTFPYISTQLNERIFYNITDNDDVPWGSTYKYTIAQPQKKKDEPAKMSISEKQKRVIREYFSNNILRNQKHKKMYPYLLSSIIFIIVLMIFASMNDINKPYLQLYK